MKLLGTHKVTLIDILQEVLHEPSKLSADRSEVNYQLSIMLS